MINVFSQVIVCIEDVNRKTIKSDVSLYKDKKRQQLNFQKVENTNVKKENRYAKA